MVKSKPGYYAVKFGRVPGIYLTWEECRAQVTKFPFAKYKKFYLREQAEKFLKGEKEVIIDINSNKLQVWTDGSTYDNGTPSAHAGIGVFWKDNDLKNLSERLPGNQTNNHAEIYAVIRAIEICENKRKLLEIITDSKYVINAIETWIKKWEKTGWISYKGAAIKNKDLFQKLKKIIDNRIGTVSFTYVRGHQGNYGNEQADKLSKIGSLKDVVQVENKKEKIAALTIKDYFK